MIYITDPEYQKEALSQRRSTLFKGAGFGLLMAGCAVGGAILSVTAPILGATLMASTLVPGYFAFKYIRKEAAKERDLEMKYFEKHISKALEKGIQKNPPELEQEKSKNWQQTVAKSAIETLTKGI